MLPSYNIPAGIALGSNIGDRLGNLRAARESILALPGLNTDAPPLVAPIYETEPIGCPPGSAPFLNTVIEIASALEPHALLQRLREIETDLGRPERYPRNAPRSIDLDILYAGDLALNTPTLILPHPRLASRRFVLTPLADIRPDLRLPGQLHTVAELLRDLPDSSRVVQMASSW